MHISSLLKYKGYQCELYDIKFESKHYKTIKKINPNIIAYSVTTNNWKRYCDFNNALKKEFKFLSVFGGPHATFFPELIYEDGIDVICRGEGEYPMLDLVNKINFNLAGYNIPNLWFKTASGIIKNNVRPLISNLDSLPFPDRELINKYKLYRKRTRIRTITSRGCPYDCSYCFNHAYRDLYKKSSHKVRRRSPENVIKEILTLTNIYNPKSLEFHDDIFILNKKWLSEFVTLYKNTKLNIPFEVNVRADLVTEEIAKLLQEAGCYSAQFGIESGNLHIRKDILNREITNEQILHSARLLKKYKIKINTFNIIGIPEETLENAIETIKLNSLAKPTYAMNSIYQPYPGTSLAEFAKKNNFYFGDVASFDRNYLYGKSVIISPDIKRLERLHYLFAFGVKYPKLIIIIKLLTKIPANKIFQSMYFLYRVFYVIFVFKRLSVKEVFLRIRAKT